MKSDTEYGMDHHCTKSPEMSKRMKQQSCMEAISSSYSHYRKRLLFFLLTQFVGTDRKESALLTKIDLLSKN